MNNLNYSFNDPSLYQLACTHPSLRGENNQRLEFIGDSVLNLLIAEALYQRYPKENEGVLSTLRATLVNKTTLAKIAKDLNLDQALQAASTEICKQPGPLADVLEALIGAIYYDSDLAHARQFVMCHWQKPLDQITPQTKQPDAKSALQTWCQRHHHPLPDYQATHEGPAHQLIFHVVCQLTEPCHQTSATASSKQQAEQQAALLMLQWLDQ